MRLEEKEKQRVKRKTLVQWINLLQYNSFCNRWQLPLSCEKTGAICIALALLDLTAGWQADEIVLNSESFKFTYWMKYSWCLTKVKCYYSCTNSFLVYPKVGF